LSFNYNKLLNIPERSLLNKKITKSFFLKNFELSSSEKKVLNNIIQSMDWISSIKPSNSNIPEYRDEYYVFEEIQFMLCTLNENNLSDNADKCISLFQKYIPYQIVLIVEDDNGFILNTCDKRINLNDKSKRTIERQISTPVISKLYKNEVTSSFLDSLDFITQDKISLQRLYKGYINSIIQLQSSLVTGSFSKRTGSRTEEDLKLLESMNTIEKEVIRLTNQLKKETQMSSKVSLNIEIQKLRNEIENIKNKLSTL
jgi:hypothetical protein